MATGYPDWVTPISIVAQALAELVNRPAYGVPKTLFFGETVAPNTFKLVGSVTGKGMMYGGFIAWSSAGECKNTEIELYLDGVLAIRYGPAALLQAGLLNNGSCYIYLLNYDDVNKEFSIGFSYPITFETSLAVYIDTYNDANHSVTMRLLYALA